VKNDKLSFEVDLLSIGKKVAAIEPDGSIAA